MCWFGGSIPFPLPDGARLYDDDQVDEAIDVMCRNAQNPSKKDRKVIVIDSIGGTL